MKPQVVTTEVLAATLRDMAESVVAGDSFEGTVEYLMPSREVISSEWADLPEEAQAWYEPHTVDPVDRVLYRLRDDADISRHLLLRGMYRIGNSLGQGGVRVLGRL